MGRTRCGITTMLVLLVLLTSKATHAGLTTLITKGSDGSPANGESSHTSISADGRYVAYQSDATNLVNEYVYPVTGIFVYDRLAGTTACISNAAKASGLVDGRCTWPSLSADGRYVAFYGYSNRMNRSMTSNCLDCIVYDRLTGVTRVVSVASDGTPANDHSQIPSISADGRHVAFISYATNLVPGDTNNCPDVFVHDMDTGETKRVSVSTDGVQANKACSYPAISADGTFVVFSTHASTLVPGDTNPYDIFVHNCETGETRRVSVASNGEQANNWCLWPSISGDGRFIAFASRASNLVSGDTNGADDIFVHDRFSRQTFRVSVSSDGLQSNNHSAYTSLNADGSQVVFASEATNLVPGDSSPIPDVYIHDLITGRTRRVSASPDGAEGNGGADMVSVSGNGQYVAFGSTSTNLVTDGQSDTNGVSDIFLTRVHSVAPISVSLSPSFGRLSIGPKLSFTSTYSDPDGFGDISDCYLLLTTLDATCRSGSAYLRYELETRKLYLRSDDDSRWVGGFETGTANTIENSQCRVFCAGTSACGSDETLSVSWAIQLKNPMADNTANAFMRVVDVFGLADDWQMMAGFSTVSSPTNLRVTPPGGQCPTGTMCIFSTSYSDPDGYSDLNNCYVILNPTLSAVNSIELIYNQVTNKLYLQNDAGNAWLGGVAPGTTGATIENSRCIVYCGDTTVHACWNDLTVCWRIAFKPIMTGKTCSAWLRVNDRAGLVDEWEKMAAGISVGGPPVNISVYPSSGSYAPGAKLTLSTSYRDPDGRADLNNCYAIVNPTLSATNSIELIYNQVTNKLFLQNDEGNTWLGGVTPGTSATIENSRCIVYCDETTVTGSGNDLTVNWRIAFKPTMVGKSCGAWLRSTDKEGLVDEWEKLAAGISVGGHPFNVGVSPWSGSYAVGDKFVFSTCYADPDGYGDLNTCYSILNPTLSAANSVELIYHQPTNRLYLQSDAGNSWLGGYAPGAAGATIENSRCIVYCEETTTSGSGTNLTVNWKVSLKSPMAGKTCGAWLRVNDRAGLVDEWANMGASISVASGP